MRDNIGFTSDDLPASPKSQLTRDERVARINKLAELLNADTPVCKALEEAGYPESTCKRGWKGVPKIVNRLLIRSMGERQERMGLQLMKDPAALEARIVGTMHNNMVQGRSKGVNAAKVLIQHKSVASAFVHESANNVVVIQAPADWKPTALPQWDDKPALPPTEADFPEYE